MPAKQYIPDPTPAPSSQHQWVSVHTTITHLPHTASRAQGLSMLARPALCSLHSRQPERCRSLHSTYRRSPQLQVAAGVHCFLALSLVTKISLRRADLPVRSRR